MEGKVDPDGLSQRWLHSHEEDTETEMVFRPANFTFPPSRGRTGFELKPDQTLVEIGIAPTDRPQESPGRWELHGEEEPVLLLSPSEQVARSLRIKAFSPERLVIKKGER
jgi:hypothetical protein